MKEARIEERIEGMLQESANVLYDAAQPNGAIVAANSLREDYPSEAENYSFVWARDNAFQLKGAKELNMPEAPAIRGRYLDWLLTRAQGFAETGLIIKRYNPNGTLDSRYGTQYQPDQAGALLWALAETRTEENAAQTDHVMRLLANGLASKWTNHSEDPNDPTGTFQAVVQDLWENREIDPAQDRSVFTYSLVACLHGLTRALDVLGSNEAKPAATDEEFQRWGEVQTSMYATLAVDGGDKRAEPYGRKLNNADVVAAHGSDPQDGLDASLSMLVHPFRLPSIGFEKGADTYCRRRQKTVEAIERELLWLPGGIKRYEGDTYDGLARPDGREASAGSWPLLSLQHVIANYHLGRWQEGRDLFLSTIATLDDLYRMGELPENVIPEQLFLDKSHRDGRGVLPLAWAHAVFPTAVKAYRDMTEERLSSRSSIVDLRVDEA